VGGKELRADLARAERLTPILTKQLRDAEKMASATVRRLLETEEARGLIDPTVAESSLTEGRAERVMIWRDIGGPLCRGLIDWHGPALTDVWDIKTTGVSLDDDTLSKWIINIGHDVQLGLYRRGLHALFSELAGRFRWRWIFVEDAAPFEVRVIEPTPGMLDLADRRAALAIEKWRRCLEADRWPGYPPVNSQIGAPDWAVERQLRIEMEDDDAIVDLAFMGDAADIDRVRQEFVDVSPAEQTAAGRAACAIDANRNSQALGVEGLLKADDASRFEIAPEEGAHDRCMIIDDVQSAILDPVAQRNHAAHPHSLLLRSGDLVPNPRPENVRKRP